MLGKLDCRGGGKIGVVVKASLFFLQAKVGGSNLTWVVFFALFCLVIALCVRQVGLQGGGKNWCSG